MNVIKVWRKKHMILDVPLISQRPELPTGCEITAVTMMLQYKGFKVDKVDLANSMPRHEDNPELGYVGDPFTDGGWTVYPSALSHLVSNVAGSSEDLTGCSNSVIEEYLSHKKPVVVWVSPIHGFTVHALVMTGFDKDNYYYNDCWSNEKDVKIEKEAFNQLWENQNRRAITY
jgi:uncharacterized protein YvpB